jgi:hypothetical protein
MGRPINIPKRGKHLRQASVCHCTIIELTVRVNERLGCESILSGFPRLAKTYSTPRLVGDQISVEAPHSVSDGLVQVDLIESKRFVVLTSRGMNLSTEHRDERGKTRRSDHQVEVGNRFSAEEGIALVARRLTLHPPTHAKLLPAKPSHVVHEGA